MELLMQSKLMEELWPVCVMGAGRSGLNQPYPEQNICLQFILKMVYSSSLNCLMSFRNSSQRTTNQEVWGVGNTLGKPDVCYLKLCRWLFILFPVKRHSYPLNKCIVLECVPFCVMAAGHFYCWRWKWKCSAQFAQYGRRARNAPVNSISLEAGEWEGTEGCWEILPGCMTLEANELSRVCRNSKAAVTDKYKC